MKPRTAHMYSGPKVRDATMNPPTLVCTCGLECTGNTWVEAGRKLDLHVAESRAKERAPS